MEVQSKITNLNELNQKMAEADDVNDQEFSEIQSERGEFSKRWSKLIQQVKYEYKRYTSLMFWEWNIVINAWLKLGGHFLCKTIFNEKGVLCDVILENQYVVEIW